MVAFSDLKENTIRNIMKRFVLMLLALAAIASCKDIKPENGVPSGKVLKEFRAEIVDAKVSTKASMDPLTGKYEWVEGDQILVDNGKSKAVFTRVSGNTFSTSEKSFEATGSYSVIYPASAYDETRSVDGKLAVNLPVAQEYDGERVEGGIYYASCTEPVVSLQGLCATVVVPLDPSKGVLRSAVLKSGSTKVGGPAFITGGKIQMDGLSNEKELTLAFTSSTAAGSVCFTLPAMIFNGGIAMDLVYADGSEDHLTNDALFSLKPGVITLMELFGPEPAFSGGKGLESDPYLISNAEDLVELSSFIADADVYNEFAGAWYRQTADIDLASVKNFPTIATVEEKPFTGHYDGDGHSLTNFVLNNEASNASGMFGYLDGAEVKGLSFVSSDVNSDYVFSGTVAGIARNSTIEGIKVRGKFRAYKSGLTVQAADYAPVASANAGYNGSIVGLAYKSVVMNCSFDGTCTIYGKFSGGIAGVSYNSTFENCAVSKESVVQIYYHFTGGIIGRALGADNLIKGCSFEGNLASTGYVNGGIVGQLCGGKVTDCVLGSYGSIGGDKYFVGGIVGAAQPVADIEISKCASYGEVRGAYSIGGVCGYSGVGAGATSDKDLMLSPSKTVTISECAFIGGRLNASSGNSYGYAIGGGIIGWSHGAVKFSLKSCYSTPSLIQTIYGKNTNGVLCGISAYQNASVPASYENCYSSVAINNFLIRGGQPSDEALWYAAIAIRCTAAATMKNCYSMDSMRLSYSSSALASEGCEQFTPAQMTDGTLLRALQSTAGEVKWIAGADGYPTIEGLPADPHVKPRTAKRVSVIGDSISTFKGIIPGGYSHHYPATDGTLTLPNETYWWRLIHDYMKDAELDMNIAFSGSTVTNTTEENYANKYGTASNAWFHNSYTERFIACGGVGNPDIILIHGGTNDWSHNADPLAPGVAIRNDSGNIYGGSAPAKSIMDAMYAVADAATTRTQVEALPDGTFCEAYIKLLCLIRERYPQCKVVCIIGDYLSQSIEQSVIDIAGHYGAKTVNLFRVNGFNDLGGYSPGTLTGLGKPQPNMPKHDHTDLNSAGGCHPGSECMRFMADKIYKELGSWLEQ